jgi:hypothetical protein
MGNYILDSLAGVMYNVVMDNTAVADILDALPPTATWVEMKDALRTYYGYDSLTDGRATDMVADYVYLSQFEEARVTHV